MKRTTAYVARDDIYLWMAAILTAILLVFLLGGATHGTDVDRPPAALPALLSDAAEPMPAVSREEIADAPTGEPSVDLVLMVWNALEHQRREEWNEALDIWYGLQLAVDAEQWRYIAMGQAHLALGEYDEAARALATAEDIQPHNAVGHYFRGLLRLEQVPHSYDWNEAEGPGPTRYAVYATDDVILIPNSRAMYRYVARMELQQAVERADAVRLDQPLTPEYWPSTVAIGPTVGDLLLATGADHFQARAHNILGGLLLEEGALDKAEYHIDQAASAGMFVSFNYVDLIDEYEGRGYYLDAARVCAKAVGHGLDEEAAHVRAMTNVRRVLGW